MIRTHPHTLLTDLISPAYLKEQRRLHKDPRGYGAKGRKWATFVDKLASDLGCSSILDYGCGQGSLLLELKRYGWRNLREYDPAVSGKDFVPEPADLVVCTDVLEHVEDDKMGAVLGDLARCTRKALFVVVGLTETDKTLSDGRQAHISLHPATWWAEQLELDFKITEVFKTDAHKSWAATLLRKAPK